ncbi:MAG: TIGR00730 family Rossman fold protein [Patescibacteria group bacterium]|nr:TIGR00730 family Rossman fold protein [Patescibacteria group bacterium]MDE2172328.1 TIGR00730 family Rossman fold protein [Patescibacteria group bacterium]
MSNNAEEIAFGKADIHGAEIAAHLARISHEFGDGFEFLKKYPKSVTVFGSSQAVPTDAAYLLAEELTGRVARELGYAVITGGGPGIMEAANKGAYQAGGVSLGLNVSIPHERMTNAYVTHAIKFSYFFSRKVMLMFAAEAYVFFPGGFGTFDELFGVLTLIQTAKIPRVPVILVDSKFWKPLQSFLDESMNKAYHAIDPEDMQLFEITDSIDRAMDIIKRAQISEWWRNIN